MAITKTGSPEVSRTIKKEISRQKFLTNAALATFATSATVETVSMLERRLTVKPYTLKVEGLPSVDTDLVKMGVITSVASLEIYNRLKKKTQSRRSWLKEAVAVPVLMGMNISAEVIKRKKSGELNDLLEENLIGGGVSWVKEFLTTPTEYLWPTKKTEIREINKRPFAGGDRVELGVSLEGENGDVDKKILMHIMKPGHILKMMTPDEITGDTKTLSIRLKNLNGKIKNNKISLIFSNTWFKAYIGAEEIKLEAKNPEEQLKYLKQMQGKTIQGIGATNNSTNEKGEGVVLSLESFFERIQDPNFVQNSNYEQNLLKINERSKQPNWFVQFTTGEVMNCTLNELRGMKLQSKDIVSITPVIAVMNEAMNTYDKDAKYPKNEAYDGMPVLNVVAFFRDKKGQTRYVTLQADFAIAQGNGYELICNLIKNQYPDAKGIVVGIMDSGGSGGSVVQTTNADWEGNTSGNPHEMQAFSVFERK